MSYRADADARGARAEALIREIADLERARVERADLDRRLEAARDELDGLQAAPPPAPPPARAPGVLAHAIVFVAAAVASAAGYAVLT